MADSVRVSGPLFDGVAARDLDGALAVVKREVAIEAEREWQTNMADSFQHATGRYQSHVNVAQRGLDRVVNDGYPGSKLLYGPWLEGLGSRNATTRFKGYFAQRRATQTVDKKVPVIAEPIIREFTAKANGV